jgi:RNA-binding protein YhbY
MLFFCIQIQTAWRGTEVVKLVIHDDKSARKINLPRFNLLLRELEERSGGVLVEAAGSSIWLYR